MKNVLITLGILLLHVASPIHFASACTPFTSTFPGSLDTFSAGDCVPAAWATELEAWIGAANSMVSSTLVYLSTHVATSSVVGLSSYIQSFTGTATTTYLSVFNSSSTVTGYSALTYTSSTNTLSVGAASIGTSTFCPSRFTYTSHI